MVSQVDDGARVPEPPASWRTRYGASLSALQMAQKTPRGVSLYSTWVNRPFGRRLAALADVLALKPNQVTVLSAVCSVGAITVLVGLRPSLFSGVLASALLVLGFALDSADGQLARLRRAGSASGEYLDHMLDCATKLGLHAAVLVAAYRLDDAGAWLIVPVAFQFVALLLFFGGILVAKLQQQSTRTEVERPARRVGSRASSVLLLPVDQGVISLSFLLWGWPEAFQAVYLLLFLAHAAVLATFSVTWFRELCR